MKNIRYLLLIIVFVVCISGCATTRSVMQSWMGYQESDVVSKWGAPTAAIDTRDGKRILTWESYWGQYGQNVCRKSFTVDESGEIIRWSYSGCLY